ncbi:glutamate synthase small subunit [candidate division KSB1 bacterium]|nr:glutamate synthase small subunit [candidate division KSB1 bacterium]
MPKHTGFLEYERQDPSKRPVKERIRDFREFEILLDERDLEIQAERCMNCGIPFCHTVGCPVFNRIPDWNVLVSRGKWKMALELLHSTNNFPEITGRLCPAPCEPACTLSINQPAVTIKQIELQLVEKGWKEGWIEPEPAQSRSSRKVAVIGSGPAGLAAAQQLARSGHEVVVFEKADRPGGLLRYGIPDFKMEKWVIDRRIEQMQQEGVIFENGVDAGTDLSVRYMKRSFDAIIITAGARVQRDIDIQGREIENIHFAMDYLVQQNKIVAGDRVAKEQLVSASNKHVVVIGGGDTGADCVGTARRQGAKSITQIEILPKPPVERSEYNAWYTWPNVLRTSSSHEEGCDRLWSISTKAFSGNGRIEKLNCAKLKWSDEELNGRRTFEEIPDSGFELKADLVLLALGFVHVEHGSLITEFNLETDERKNIRVDPDYMTSVPGVFAAGDCVTGASLIVRSIYQGREAAAGVDRYLNSL